MVEAAPHGVEDLRSEIHARRSHDLGVGSRPRVLRNGLGSEWHLGKSPEIARNQSGRIGVAETQSL